MSLFSEYSTEQLEAVKSVPLTMQDLRVLQLALAGDTFAPGSNWQRALESAVAKIDICLDEVRSEILRGENS